MPAGTVMRGGVRVGDTVELPELRQQKKIKSMQMFRWGQELSYCVSRALPEQLQCTVGYSVAM